MLLVRVVTTAWLALSCAGACRPSSNAKMVKQPEASLTSAAEEKQDMEVKEEGSGVPDVSFLLHDGSEFRLSDAKEGFVFVYFYPKDDTPGCTIEATGLRDHYQNLQAVGIKVIGVSLQDAVSHQKFIDKYELPFPLAVDDGSIAEAFGVPTKGEYAARQSFLIKDGRMVRVWREVKPAGHAEEVLAAVDSLR